MGDFLDETCRIEVTDKTVEMFMQLYYEAKPEAQRIFWELKESDHQFGKQIDKLVWVAFHGKKIDRQISDALEAAIERELQSFYTINDINKWADEVNV